MSPHKKYLKYQQYSQISIGNEIYKEKDAVIINGESGKEIAVIKHIYASHDESLLNVGKYIFAKNLRKLFVKQKLNYDKNNEVVQDMTKCYDVSLKQVLKKCILAFPHINDETYYTEHNNLDLSDFFSCRYYLKDNFLFPLHSQQTVLHTPQGITEKYSDKSMNPPVTEVNSNIEIHFKNDYFSPTQRNQVKRNLNKSFGNSPSSKDKSILDYEIHSLSDDDDDIEQTTINKENHVTTPVKVRKSNRNISRKSYVDYISPKKTPSKRRLKSVSSDDDDWDQIMKNKVSKNTPQKTIRGSRTTPRRKTKPPQRYVEQIEYCQRTPRITPARRSLKLTKSDEDQSHITTKSIKNLDSCNKKDNTSKNLDESLRRNVFKNSLKKTDENDQNSKLINYDSDNEDADNNKETNLDNSNPCNIRIILKRLNLSTDDTNNTESSSVSDNEDQSTPKKRKPTKIKAETPKTPKSSKKPPTKSKWEVKSSPKSTPKTPKNRAKLIREGIVTPSMQKRSKKIQGNTTPLMQARAQLHVSFVPDSLPCREKEYCDIYNFLEGKLLDGCGGCMYISGVPGTGKTATVTSVINHLQNIKRIPKFNFININGMRLTEPKQSYVEILKQLKGKTVPWEQAQHTLEDLFVNCKKMEPTVMLIDELDILCTKRQDVVYNLLDWPTKAKNQLVVITIANTMDLPERLLMSRVTSRLGLTRLTFQPYTFKQLQEIVTKRLSGTNSFNPDAVQFVARKVASVSGDARRALDICRRSAEIAEAEGKTQSVGMNHVNEALNAMITQPKILAIKCCSRLEQLILQSIVAEVERTGVEETTFRDVYQMMITCSAIEGFKMVSSTLVQNAIMRLSAYRLILAEQKCNNIYQKIILNVSNDDIYYALQKNYS
ncbi:origin recognition complex subunit 1 [Diorhabda sublineata]|uniref:origin recognition complex subunit 1 n=1 Tax=Diorhabda sublineata TaxID=1163346 RepID=UPI0024E15448|nr:origin recognition complex subunit 1 [Diorhabda sublineata]